MVEPPEHNPGQLLIQIAGFVEKGQGVEAIEVFETLLEQVPGVADLWFKAAQLAETLDDTKRAMAFHLGGLRADPANEQALEKVIPLLRGEGRFDEASNLYLRALAVLPDNPKLLIGWGAILLDLRRPEEAEAAFRKAAVLDPENPEAQNNIGVVQNFKGAFLAGIPFFRRALQLAPDYVSASLNLGAALAKTGQAEEAIKVCRNAAELAPRNGEVWARLGTALKLDGQLVDAVEALEKALLLDPSNASARYALGNVLHTQGKTKQARAVFKGSGEGGMGLREALLVPIIAETVAEIADVRDGLGQRLNALEADAFQLDEPRPEVRFTNFLLAYHDANDRPLQERIAKFYRKVCPMLSWAAPHCEKPKKNLPGERVKVGIVSAFMHGHTIGKLYGGLIEDLPRDRFEVTLIRAGGPDDPMAQKFEEAADHVVHLSDSLRFAREAIAACELDLLFYPDIGMDALTYFLAYARLAPVQMTSLGHPMTTGLSTMDYFLTAKTNEAGDISDHYTETPLMLSRGPVFMRRPDVPTKPLEREALGLPEDKRLYVCPQTLFKFHPDFDRVLGDLLDADQEGLLVLIGDHVGGSWERILLDRFAKTFPQFLDRVVFTRRLSGDEYMGLLMMSDALLDIPQFSGGNSSLEAFACGAPIVTRPSAYMKGRLTDGYYREMELMDLVAKDDEEYVSLALKLAQDKGFHAQMSERIQSLSYRLFDRQGVVVETADLIEKAVAAARMGEKMS